MRNTEPATMDRCPRPSLKVALVAGPLEHWGGGMTFFAFALVDYGRSKKAHW